ncbi:MAG: response regulator [Ramlibacter sp.]
MSAAAAPETWSERRHVLLAIGVLLAGLAVTYVVVRAQSDAQEAEVRARFDGAAQRLEYDVQRRIIQAAYGLHGMAAAYAAVGDLGPAQFRDHVAARSLKTEFPGVVGFGFVQRVPREGLKTFVAARQAVTPAFKVQTSGHAPDLYIVKYVEPDGLNHAALGFDLGQEAVRREALERAVATASMSLSGRIAVIQDERRRSGWLMIVPLYKAGTDARSLEGRRRSLLGLLYAPIIVAEVLNDVKKTFESHLDFRLFDGNIKDGRLLFDTEVDQLPALPSTGRENPDPFLSRFVRETRVFEIGGHRLSLQVASTPELEAATRSNVLRIFEMIGSLLSLLLAFSVWQLLSGRKRAESIARAMTADLSRLAKVVEHTSNAVMVLDREMRVTWLNQGFTRIFGYTESDAMGQVGPTLIGHPSSLKEHTEALERAMRDGDGARLELRSRASDGSEIWTATELLPMRDAAGAIAGCIEIALDVTARKLAEQRLTSSQSFLEQAEQIANVGGWEVNLETLEVRLSLQTLRIFDLAPGSTTSMQQFIEYFDPASQEEIDRTTQHAIKTGEPWDLELILVSAAGRKRWVRTVGRVERRGQWSTRLLGTLQDVSERHAMEEDLRESEDLMRVVTDNIPGRVGYWDRNLRGVFVNRAYGDTFGKTREEMIGHTLSEVLGPERFAAYRDSIERALGGESQAFEREEVDVAGKVRTMFVHYISDVRNGEVHGFFVLALDITELKQARDAARQASAAKGEFLANTSHEIRTPMNAVLGMLKLLQSTQLTARQLDYVKKAEGASRSLLALLNDILDFSKVEAGKLELDPREFSLDTLLRDLSVILAANLQSESVEILFEIDPAIPAKLRGDDMRLRQVLINLGGNATKFTEKGEVVISARRLPDDDGQARVEFSVRDSGIGITEEQRSRIFEGFSQAEASTVRRFGGTGLGLAISQRLVQLMGGKLELESEPGRGSRFYFTLLLTPEGGVAPAAPAQSPPLRVLFIDDNPLARQILSAQARSLGWQPDTASSGQEGIDILRSAAVPYDAVFVDWLMPGIDGLQTSEAVRGLPEFGASAMVIMVTAQGRLKFAERSEEEQGRFDGYLVKPVTASMLRQAFAEARGQEVQDSTMAQWDTFPLEGLALLVVEDNRTNQQVARELLEGKGAVVDLAADGSEAVSKVTGQARAYDLVLMDLQMPVMDGFQATQLIRGDARFDSLPIVAMTANTMTGDREASLAAGMDDHVGKPFDLDELVQVILSHTRGPKKGLSRRTRAADTSGDAAAATDFEGALKRLGGDLSFFRVLYPQFQADTAGMIDSFAEALAAGRRDVAGRLAHTVKGLGATLGASALSLAAQRAEAAMNDAPGDDDAKHTGLMKSAFVEACAGLDAELAVQAAKPRMFPTD